MKSINKIIDNHTELTDSGVIIPAHKLNNLKESLNDNIDRVLICRCKAQDKISMVYPLYDVCSYCRKVIL